MFLKRLHDFEHMATFNHLKGILFHQRLATFTHLHLTESSIGENMQYLSLSQ